MVQDKPKSSIPGPSAKVTNLIRNQTTSTTTRVIVTPTSNEYSVLEDNADEVITIKEKKIKLPPISVAGINHTTAREFMKSLEINDYQLRPFKEGMKIFCDSIESHNKVRNSLKHQNIGHFSHDLPSEKYFKVVLSGLHDMPITDLKTELMSKKVSPVDIKIINPKNPRYNGHVNFILYFTKNSIELKFLKEIKALFHTIVKWEPFRNSRKGYTQCSVCQRPGHGGRHCLMPPRCLYCAGNHESKNCKTYLDAINKASSSNQNPAHQIEVGITAKCANCGGKHFASDLNCPFKKKYLESKLRMNQQNNSRRLKTQLPNPDDFQFDMRGQPLNQLTHQGRYEGRHEGRHEMMQNSISWADQVSDTAFPRPNNSHLTHNPNPFSIDEIMSLTSDVLSHLQNIRTASRVEVIKIVMQVSLKYLYNDFSK